MPLSPRTLRPRAGGVHPEAASWQSRVIANGGTVGGSGTLRAVSDFCRSIDANGLRSLLWRVNLMCGSDLLAALVPLYRANSSTGAVQGNLTDTNDNFVSGDYSATSGLLGNGSTKRLNTGLPVNFTSLRHLGCFAHTLPTSTFRTYLGATGASGTTGSLLLQCGSPTTNFSLSCFSDAGGSGGNSGTATHAAGDVIIGSHGSGVGSAAAYANGTQTGTSGNGNAAGSVTTAIVIFATLNSAGTYSAHSNGRIGGYTIGANLTSGQVATYTTIWNTLLKALGRK